MPLQSQAASSEWPACAHDPLPRVGRRLAAMHRGLVGAWSHGTAGL